MSADFIYRTFAQAGLLFAEMIRLRLMLRQTRAWWVNVEKQVHALGPAYNWIWKYPVRFLATSLWAILLCAVLVLCIGIYVIVTIGSGTAADAKLATMRSSRFWDVALGIHDHAWYLVVGYFVIVLLVASNALPRLLLAFATFLGRFKPSLLFSPGYVAAAWQLNEDGEAAAVNIEPSACMKYAAAVGDSIAAGEEGWRKDRASMPAVAGGLTHHERANLLLVGNTFEGAMHLSGKPAVGWKRVYDLLAEIAAGADKPFSPEKLRAAGAADKLYAYLREVAKDEKGILPDSPAIAADVSECVRLLVAKYSGSAANLVGGWIGTPSLSRARKHLEAFPQMGEGTPKFMGPQFLRLAVRWNVWPGIKSAPLVYGSPSRVLMGKSQLAYLFDTGCLIASKQQGVPNDDHMKRVAVKAMHEISKHFLKTLNDSSAAGPMLALRTEISPQTPPTEGQVFDWMDTFIWSAAYRRTTAGDVLNPAASWIVGNTISHK